MNIKEQLIQLRGRVFDFVFGYWWVWLILIAIGYFFTDFPVFKYLIYIIAIPFALLIFLPFIIQLFSPAFILVSSLIEHFKESKSISFGRKYIFIPIAIISSVSFITAQIILSTWVFVLSILIWSSIIGFFFTFLLVFLFGLAPVAIITAPFVVWFNLGFTEFLNVIVFFILALFWYGFSKLAFSEDYFESTPEDFIGYSPQTFLLGALSLQIVALPLYAFGLNLENSTLIIIGNWVSLLGGGILLLLAIISAIIWQKEKKKLSPEQKQGLYKPPVWIYIFGLLLTSILYNLFTYEYGVIATILYWLNGFFLIALMVRFIGFIKRKVLPPAKAQV